MKLGVNTVLFKSFDVVEAMQAIKMIGYDGVEISAIKGMCEHLVLDDWKNSASLIKSTAEELDLELLSMEVASRDEDRLRKAFEAARYLGIPVVNIGPGGKSNVDGDLDAVIEILNARSKMAEEYGVTLCCKAHVGAAMYNTPTTVEVAQKVTSSAFGVDMDPSHIYRAGELPEQAVADVIKYMKHVHIRDCKGRGPSPGEPMLQICGKGDINLHGYLAELVKADYDGPVCLEIIGPAQTMQQATVIAAESFGYMNACLKAVDGR